MAGQSSKKVEEIQKLMPDDFNRKLKEWEQIKETGEKGRHGMEPEQSREAMRRRSSSSSNSHPVLLNRKGHKMSIKHRHDKSSRLDHAAGGFVVSGAKSALVATKTVQERDSAWLEKEIHRNYTHIEPRSKSTLTNHDDKQRRVVVRVKARAGIF